MIGTIRHFLGYEGRMICASKSRYREQFPDSRPVFNSNLYVGSKKAWHGDVDLVSDDELLQNIADALGESIYIFVEHPFRWMKEEDVNLEMATATYVPREN